MSPAKVTLVGQSVLKVCDLLDGLADGIVSNYDACGTALKMEMLRCPDASDMGDTCLSDRQLAAIAAVHSPYQFSFELANGVRTYPPFGYGGEAQAGGFPTWVTGAKMAVFPAPSGGGQGQQWSFGNGVIRYFILQDGSRDPLTYSPDAYADRVRYVSSLMDSTNPDLSAFSRRGGKVILKEHMADYAQSPFAGIAQFVDLLAALDVWVETRRAPADPLVQTSMTTNPPYSVTASRPMCRYPQYPRYRGSGDPKVASSFVCTSR